MKSDTTTGLKFRRLKHRLRMPEWQVIGVLQALWMFCGNNCPDGHLGKFTPDDIAIGLEMDPTQAWHILHTLVQEKWIDDDPELGWVIHDWDQHCELTYRRRTERAFERGQSPWAFAADYIRERQRRSPATRQQLSLDFSSLSSTAAAPPHRAGPTLSELMGSRTAEQQSRRAADQEPVSASRTARFPSSPLATGHSPLAPDQSNARPHHPDRQPQGHPTAPAHRSGAAGAQGADQRRPSHPADGDDQPPPGRPHGRCQESERGIPSDRSGPAPRGQPDPGQGHQPRPRADRTPQTQPRQQPVPRDAAAPAEPDAPAGRGPRPSAIGPRSDTPPPLGRGQGGGTPVGAEHLTETRAEGPGPRAFGLLTSLGIPPLAADSLTKRCTPDRIERVTAHIHQRLTAGDDIRSPAALAVALLKDHSCTAELTTTGQAVRVLEGRLRHLRQAQYQKPP